MKEWEAVNVHEAKTHLSRLLSRVAAGEEVVIARAGKPIARLVPVGPAPGDRGLGMDRACAFISEDFDAPLPKDILATFDAHRPRRKGLPTHGELVR